MITPDIVEYDEKKMDKPMFDLILGVNTLSKLGIVLDFNTKNITIGEIILPMRDINKLSNKFKIDWAWPVNNNVWLKS